MKMGKILFTAVSLFIFSSIGLCQSSAKPASESNPFNSTYLGGSGAEHISAPKVDIEGNIFITGYCSAEIPGIPPGVTTPHSMAVKGMLMLPNSILTCPGCWPLPI